MSLDPNFKQFARKVSDALWSNGITADVYALLNIADALYVAPETAPTFAEVLDDARARGGHERLVKVAQKDDGRSVPDYAGRADTITVMGHIADRRKILAIKRLRALTNCGLREAKEAVEDPRVSVF